MLREQKTTKKQGDVGLGAAIGWFAEKGYTVCVPLTDSQCYDLVVDDGGLKRVQVKTVWTQRRGRYEVELRTRGGNRSGWGVSKDLDLSTVDLLFILTDDGTEYLIPSDKLGGVAMIVLGDKYKEFIVREATIR